MKPRLLVPLIFICGLLTPATIPGDVVFTSFGTNNSFNPNLGFAVEWNVLSPGSVANVGEGMAARFTVGGQSYSLTSITLALGYFQDTNNLSFSIVTDNSGAPTGPLVETVAAHPAGITNTAQIVSYQSSLSPVLAAGATYWLVAEPIDLNTTNAANNSAYGWWQGAVAGVHAQEYFNFQTGSWDAWQVRPPEFLPAFRIEGFAIPEPTALSLLLFGACLLGLRLRRKT